MKANGFDFHICTQLLYDSDDTRLFRKKYKVTGNYTSDVNSSAFFKWLDAETEWYIPAGENYYRDPDNQFHLSEQTQGTFPNTLRPRIKVQTTEYTKKWETGRITATIKLQLVNGILIFETVPDDLDTDVFYESEQTFKIENGLHKGNHQDQTSSLPAICNLNFYNCFSFGNGLESINIRDDRFTYSLSTDYRPNIVLQQGYKELTVTHGLIHSGSFNENSGYNAINEFNSSRGITKNLDTKFGSIQKVYSRERDLVVFQEDRVSKVLYGKTILTSPDGTGSLSQIESVLGQDVPYSGEYGISKDPESFASFEGRMYFTDANRGSVLRLSSDGITPISYAGMKSFFKEELYNNKLNWNIGGFDPKYHQYVLTMGSEEKPTEGLTLDCASTFTRTIDSAYSYKLSLGTFSGTTTFNYTTSSAMVISVSYNGNTYQSGSLSGTGTYTFPVSASDINASNLATVTITPSSSADVTIVHQCPQPDTLEVVLLVVNDAGETGETIINRFKHSGAEGGGYDSTLDVFENDEVTRFETISGFMGTDIIPDNGDTVTISSLKQYGVNTGDFNVCNSLGWYVSAQSNLTAQNIVDSANYETVTGQTLANGDVENYATFTFNRNNTSEKLYLVWNYRDELPNLVGDTVTSVPNGGSVNINVLANDTVVSPYTVSIGTAPTNGTAVVNSDNTITFTHTAGASTTGSFTYIVTREGDCFSEATVTTEVNAISPLTWMYIYFDRSGSMSNTESDLDDMVANSLKSVLQDFYATGLTESEEIAQGLTPNPATNGSNDYDARVNIVYSGDSIGWDDERCFRAMSDPDVNDYVSTSTHNNFPSQAANVIFIVFQDEAATSYHDFRSSGSFSSTDLRTPTYDTDIATLRSRISSLNTNNAGFYKGAFIQVKDSNGSPNYPFKALLQAVENGDDNYSGNNGLSDKVGGSNPVLTFKYDVEDSTGSDATAPFKPGSSTDRFDKWEYYYLYHVTDALNNLSVAPSSVTWPVIKDDN